MAATRRRSLGTVVAIMTVVLVAIVEGQGGGGCIEYTDPTVGNPWICSCPSGGSMDQTGCYDSCMVTYDTCACGGGANCGDSYNACGDACLKECQDYEQSCTSTSQTTSPATTTSSNPTTTSVTLSPTVANCAVNGKRALLKSACTYRGLTRCKENCGTLVPTRPPGKGNGCGREIDDLLRAVQGLIAPDFTPACNSHDACFDTCDNSGSGFEACNTIFSQNLDASCSNQKQAVYSNCQQNICRGLTAAQRAKCLLLPASVKECDDEWEGYLHTCQVDAQQAYDIVQSRQSCQAYRSGQASHCECKVKQGS